MLHKGEVIHKAIKESGFQVAQVAKRLHRSRQHMYDIFDKAVVSMETIEKIGKIIDHDFSKDFKKEYQELNGALTKLEESIPQYQRLQRELEETKIECEVWKNKYLRLLEEHTICIRQSAKKSKQN